MKYHLIFTLDYELFGNGSGCIDQCLVAPTDRCAGLLEAAGAPLTLFIETLELAHFKASSQPPIHDLYPKIKAQLIELEQKGHKLELHLHPQWMHATQNKNEWTLALDKWRIGDLSTPEIRECIQTGIDYLAPFLTSNQNPTVFRAGGWAMQPSKNVLTELLMAGLKVDSTVAPGAYNPSRGDWFDFRQSSTKPFWKVADDICVESLSGGLLEVPIATENIGRRTHLRALKENKTSAQFPEGCVGSYAGPNNKFQSLQGKLAKLMNVGTAMLDFSTLPAWAMIEVTERYMARFSSFEGTVPIVAIGHNKNFSKQSEDNLEAYLEWAKVSPDIVFSTYNQWLDTTSSPV